MGFQKGNTLGRQFQKGNKAQKKSDPRVKCAKSLCKAEIAQHVSSLFAEEISIIKARLKNPKTLAFRYMLDRAIVENDTSFIKWLIEMFIGKPKQTLETEDRGKPIAQIKRPDGSIVELTWTTQETSSALVAK